MVCFFCANVWDFLANVYFSLNFSVSRGSICELMISGCLSSEELPFIVEGRKVQITTVEFVSINVIFIVEAKWFYKQIVWSRLAEYLYHNAHSPAWKKYFSKTRVFKDIIFGGLVFILVFLKDSGYSSATDKHLVMSVRVSPLLLFKESWINGHDYGKMC